MCNECNKIQNASSVSNEDQEKAYAIHNKVSLDDAVFSFSVKPTVVTVADTSAALLSSYAYHKSTGSRVMETVPLESANNLEIFPMFAVKRFHYNAVPLIFSAVPVDSNELCISDSNIVNSIVSLVDHNNTLTAPLPIAGYNLVGSGAIGGVRSLNHNSSCIVTNDPTFFVNYKYANAIIIPDLTGQNVTNSEIADNFLAKLVEAKKITLSSMAANYDLWRRTIIGTLDAGGTNVYFAVTGVCRQGVGFASRSNLEYTISSGRDANTLVDESVPVVLLGTGKTVAGFLNPINMATSDEGKNINGLSFFFFSITINLAHYNNSLNSPEVGVIIKAISSNYIMSRNTVNRTGDILKDLVSLINMRLTSSEFALVSKKCHCTTYGLDSFYSRVH